MNDFIGHESIKHGRTLSLDDALNYVWYLPDDHGSDDHHDFGHKLEHGENDCDDELLMAMMVTIILGIVNMVIMIWMMITLMMITQ